MTYHLSVVEVIHEINQHDISHMPHHLRDHIDQK